MFLRFPGNEGQQAAVFFFAAAEGTTVSGTSTDQFHNIISKYRWLRSTARNQKDLASYDIQLREAILF